LSNLKRRLSEVVTSVCW